MTSKTENIAEIKLDLPFKGERDYIHGTDLFDALLKHTQARGPTELRINEAMRYPINVLPQNIAEEMGRPSGIFVNQGVRLSLFQDPSRKIASRVPYDETLVVDGFELGDNCIALDVPNDYSIIERCVALNKLMLTKLHGNSIRWLFTRLTLSEIPEVTAAIQIELRQQLGTRIIKSALFFDHKESGEIYFSGAVT